MCDKITRTISEQHELFREFSDPIEFMMIYISVYEQQLKCSTKVFLQQIPYYRVFQACLVERVLDMGLDRDAGLQSLDGLEAVLVGFQKRRFYDREFYHCCADILATGFNIVLEQVQNEVLYECCYKNVDRLYKYTDEPIDLSSLIGRHTAQRISRSPTKASIILEELGRTMSSINRQIKDAEPSQIITNLSERQSMDKDPAKIVRGEEEPVSLVETCRKVHIEASLLGSVRLKSYELRNVISEVVTVYKYIQAGNPKCQASESMLGLASALACIDGCSSIAEGLREYANEMLLVKLSD